MVLQPALGAAAWLLLMLPRTRNDSAPARSPLRATIDSYAPRGVGGRQVRRGRGSLRAQESGLRSSRRDAGCACYRDSGSGNASSVKNRLGYSKLSHKCHQVFTRHHRKSTVMTMDVKWNGSWRAPISVPFAAGWPATSRSTRSSSNRALLCRSSIRTKEDRQRAFYAGYQAHLTKPYEVAHLVATLRRLRGKGADLAAREARRQS